MSTEVTPGGQSTLDRQGTLADQDTPYDERFTATFVDRDPAEDQPEGGEGMAWFWARFGEAFSDLEHDVIEVVATPEHLVTVMNLSGTHTGEYRGFAPTGKRFTVRNVQVLRFSEGRAAERWGSTDELGILTQLGLLQERPGGDDV